MAVDVESFQQLRRLKVDGSHQQIPWCAENAGKRMETDHWITYHPHEVASSPFCLHHLSWASNGCQFSATNTGVNGDTRNDYADGYLGLLFTVSTSIKCLTKLVFLEKTWLPKNWRRESCALGPLDVSEYTIFGFWTCCLLRLTELSRFSEMRRKCECFR